MSKRLLAAKKRAADAVSVAVQAEEAAERIETETNTASDESKLLWWKRMNESTDSRMYRTTQQCANALNISTVTARRYKKGLIPWSGKHKGRKPLLTDWQIDGVVREIQARIVDSKAPTQQEMYAIMCTYVREHDSQGAADNSKFLQGSPHKTWWKEFADRVNGKWNKGQPKTDVRAVAERSIRSALSFGSVFNAIITMCSGSGKRDIIPSLILNVDATSLKVIQHADQKRFALSVVKHTDHDFDELIDASSGEIGSTQSSQSTTPVLTPASTPLLTPTFSFISTPASASSSTLLLPNPLSYESDLNNPIFIKWYATISGSGVLLPPLIVLVNSQLKSGEYRLQKVMGFSAYADSYKPGFILFQNTTQATPAVFKTLLEEIWIPYIAGQRRILTNNLNNTHYIVQPDAGLQLFNEHFSTIDPEANGRAMLIFDGEAQQLSALRSDDMLDRFKLIGMDLMKTSASRTAVEQPCDVGPLFRIVKQCINSVKKFEVVSSGGHWDLIAINIRNALGAMLKGERTNQWIQFVTAGLMRFIATMQLHFDVTNVVKGFNDSGLVPFNMSKILRSSEEFSKFQHLFRDSSDLAECVRVKKCCQYAKQHGRVTDEFYCEIGFSGDTGDDELDAKLAAGQLPEEIFAAAAADKAQTTSTSNSTTAADFDDTKASSFNMPSSSIKITPPSEKIQCAESDIRPQNAPLHQQRAVWISAESTIKREAEVAAAKLLATVAAEAAKERRKVEAAERKQLTELQSRREAAIKQMHIAWKKQHKTTMLPSQHCCICFIPWDFMQLYPELCLIANELNRWSHCAGCDSWFCCIDIHSGSLAIHQLKCLTPTKFTIPAKDKVAIALKLANANTPIFKSATPVTGTTIDHLLQLQHRFPVNLIVSELDRAVALQIATTHQPILIRSSTPQFKPPQHDLMEQKCDAHCLPPECKLDLSDPVNAGLQLINDGVWDQCKLNAYYGSNHITYYNQPFGTARHGSCFDTFNIQHCQSGCYVWIFPDSSCIDSGRTQPWQLDQIIMHKSTLVLVQWANDIVFIPPRLQFAIFTMKDSISHVQPIDNLYTALSEFCEIIKEMLEKGSHSLVKYGLAIEKQHRNRRKKSKQEYDLAPLHNYAAKLQLLMKSQCNRFESENFRSVILKQYDDSLHKLQQQYHVDLNSMYNWLQQPALTINTSTAATPTEITTTSDSLSLI